MFVFFQGQVNLLKVHVYWYTEYLSIQGKNFIFRIMIGLQHNQYL